MLRDQKGRRGGCRLSRIMSACRGSVALESAAMAPLVIVFTTVIVDIGLITTRTASLAGATSVGAEYARLHPADTTGIKNAMTSAMSFSPPLTFPPNFSETCECDDGTGIACSASCAEAGRPSPNRVFIRISASQPFAPLLPLPGLPGVLTSAVEIRLQ